MRIVSVQYVHNNYGDPQRWLERIAFYTGIFEALAKNHEVYSFYHIDYQGNYNSNNVTYHFTGLTGLNLIFPFKFHQKIARLNPDIILAQGFHHPFQLWLLRRKMPASVRFFIHHHAERPLRFHWKFFQKLIDPFVSGYFFVSRLQADPWVVDGQIREKKKVYEVMECSSIYQKIDRYSAREKTGVSGKVYLWVGRLEANKDPITLVKAFTAFASSEESVFLYVIYQQEDLLEEIKSLAKAESRIRLIGRQNKEQLLHWYNSADFIVSTSHYEGSGIAVCEAMSCGCIPILSAIPSFRWMTNEDIGLHFKAGDENQLLSALKKSLVLDLDQEQKRTIENFQARLSFSAIASRMTQAFLR